MNNEFVITSLFNLLCFACGCMMMLFGASFLCFIVVITATGPLTWPDEYSAEGTISLPYSEIYEPFSAVVDMKNGISKITYYDGKWR